MKWSQGDTDALIGVFADGFSKVIAATIIMTFTLKIPTDIIYGKIVPGIGLTILFLNGYFS